MVYKILHLPTGTYMYYSLLEGKIWTKNFYTQYEIESNRYHFGTGDNDKPTTLFKDKNTARRFLEMWERLKHKENNGSVDYLVFDYGVEYVFNKAHFSIIKV